MTILKNSKKPRRNKEEVRNFDFILICHSGKLTKLSFIIRTKMLNLFMNNKYNNIININKIIYIYYN